MKSVQKGDTYTATLSKAGTLSKGAGPISAYRKTSQRYLAILVPLIFFTLSISACSNQKLSDSTLPTAGASPIATPAPSSSASVSAPAPTPTPQSLAISAASEELSTMGFDEYNQFNYDTAISYFDRAINLDTNNYKAYNGKGIALCFKGQYTNGMPLIQKALNMKPDYANGYFNMAMAYKLQKDYDNSLVYFNKALTFDPKDTWSYYGIATIYADRGDINTSLEYLKKAIDIEPAVKDVAKEQDHFQPYLNNEAFQKLVG